METASFVLSIIALTISATLGGIKIWETWFRRSKFGVKFDWIQHRGAPILTWVIYNSGWKRDGVREIRFGSLETPDTEGWIPQRAVLERLPVMLDVDEISPRFYINTVPSSTDVFDVALRGGRIRKMVLTNARRKRSVYEVPPP
jgi:hypothetical protein